MIVSHKHKFIFIHPHKTAGESVAAMLDPFLGPTDIVRPARGALRNSMGPVSKWLDGPLYKHCDAATVEATLEPGIWEEYFRFATIRHPFARLQSYYDYLEKSYRLRQRWPRHRKIRAALGLIDDPLKWGTLQLRMQSDSFSTFIRQPSLANSARLGPQTARLEDASGALSYDMFVRVESFDQDVRELFRRLGLPEVDPKKVNASRAPGERPRLGEADRALLAKRYATDLDAFGYSADAH